MTNAALDRLLALLVLAMAATGLLTLRAGIPEYGWLFTAHGLLGGLLLAAVALKIRRSLPRAAHRVRDRGHAARLALGLLVSGLAGASLIAGFVWVAGGSILRVSLPNAGSVTILTLHVWFGLVLAPFLVVHLLPRRWRLLRPGPRALRTARGRLLSRRSLVTGGALGVVSLGVVLGVEALDRLRGGARRYTGSRALPIGGSPPQTTFFGEPTPTIDLAAWRLRVGGRVDRPGVLTLDELESLGQRDLTAVLDCTSGWAVEATWGGVFLADVLRVAGPAPSASTVEVRSVTGWTSSFPIAEALGILLATRLGESVLPAGNGAPCRLVVPTRRGLDWVKWVSEVRVL